MPLSAGIRPASKPRQAGSGAGAASGGYVLPRFLRRPARWWSRAVSGEMHPPRFAATMLSAALLGGFSLYGAHAGGHFPAIAEFVAANSGFAIDDIRVEGHVRVSEIDIVDVLGLDGSTSMLQYSAAEARDRIASLPWVERASVRKSYPSTLEIELVERKPYAIWQSGSRLSLIDRKGDVIVPLPGRDFIHLPLVIGFGAPGHAEDIVALASAHPELFPRIKAFIRVGDRRWDLRFENGINVRLPDHGVAAALTELAALDRGQRILSRDIAAIDLRLVDRVVVELTAEAAVRRAALVAERGKRRTGRGI